MSNSLHSPRLALGSWAFSFGPYADHPWSFERACRFAASAGYDGIEINGFRPHPHHRDYDDIAKSAGLRELMVDAGVTPVAYAPDFTAVPPGEVAADAYLAEIDAACALCERLEVSLLRVDTVSSPDRLPPGAHERRFEHLATTWGAAAGRAERSGVTLVWEFEPGVWLNRPSDVLRLLEAINHPAFRVLFDSSHAYTCAVAGARQGPEPEILPGGEVELAQLLEPYLGHLHLIDSDGSLHNGETSAHLPFGTGKIDFPALLSALAPAIDGLAWWGIDFCFCPTTAQDAPMAVPFVRNLADQLHDSRV